MLGVIFALELIGFKVIVFTNHDVLRNLFAQKDVKSRLIRLRTPL
jgi:hypothetical protein